MTALKPIENRRVRGVASERYPVNELCAHPDCSEPATVHHIFPRSQTKSDSYFVEIITDATVENGGKYEATVIPHAVGLCGSGTTGHHGDVEEHRAWIKLEDGAFVWYDRRLKTYDSEEEMLLDRYERGSTEEWVALGALNPQPGSREGKPKRKRTVKGTSERAKRKTVSVRLPEGFDGEAWDDLIELVDEYLKALPDSPLDSSKDEPVVGVCVVYGLQALLGLGG